MLWINFLCRSPGCVGIQRLSAGKEIDMTAHKHLKETIRVRMRKTGESYTTARRHIVRQVEVPKDASATRWHFPGNIPATTALRVLLTAAGIRDPRNGNPLSEAMLFGICGGIGLGMASFICEKENFSSFYVGGRHLWNDDLDYLQATLGRFGIKPIVHEGKAASLSNVLAVERPCIAFARPRFSSDPVCRVSVGRCRGWRVRVLVEGVRALWR